MAFEWVEPFLKALAESPNVTAACEAAGISRVQAYAHRKADPAFATAWEDAQDQSTDALVGEMYRRAMKGVREPVYFKGHRCGYRRRYSNTLAIFLAKCHRPEVYGDKLSAMHSGDVTIRVEYDDGDDADAEDPEAPPGPAEDHAGGPAV